MTASSAAPYMPPSYDPNGSSFYNKIWHNLEKKRNSDHDFRPPFMWAENNNSFCKSVSSGHRKNATNKVLAMALEPMSLYLRKSKHKSHFSNLIC